MRSYKGDSNFIAYYAEISRPRARLTDSLGHACAPAGMSIDVQ
jgi:hypothetical protein